jgi:hypothetical protein
LSATDARDAFLAGLEREGVLMIAYPGSGLVRAVTHYGIDATDIERSINAAARALRELGGSAQETSQASRKETVAA